MTPKQENDEIKSSTIFKNTSTKKKQIVYISPSKSKNSIGRIKPSPNNPNLRYEIEDLATDRSHIKPVISKTESFKSDIEQENVPIPQPQTNIDTLNVIDIPVISPSS